MGLLRAALITLVAYFAIKFVQERWLQSLPADVQAKAAPWLPLGVVFIVELLL